MIILKGISRIYQPKKGVPVKALDKVDLQLPDKGMVFILGKSGSGKSTLLNVVGGLDKYDEGELIVKDKSTKNFSQNDFDSYRNTMVGFIFQEYNVLDDFTVAQNIGLALELQGIKVTNEKVNHILELVDLGGLGARKPNELSGGQKQRVAIARALVKEPEIIMADEPTGALDSETGKQILETLKNLSKTRLVMVVSHDREFANTYGDRIVEFMDGKIISDVSRTTSGVESDTPFQISNNNLEVKAGYTLTPEDLRVINEYLEKSKEDLKITKLEGQSDGSFFVTDPNSIKLSKEQYKPIKSRLPFKSSLKIGASSLRHKRIRLTISIILAAVSLTLFGLSDTFGAYKPEKAAEISIKEAGYDFYSISKVNRVPYGNWISENHVGFHEEDIGELNNKFPSANFIGVYKLENYWISFSESIYNLIPNTDIYMFGNEDLSGFSELKTSDLNSRSLNLLAGRLAIADDEIAITKFVYSFFEKYNLRSLNDGSEVIIKNYSQILNQEIQIGSRTFKVVGIIDTNLDTKPYEKLASPELSIRERSALQYKLETELSTSFHLVGFLRSGYAAENITSPGTNRHDVMSNLELSANGGEIYFQRIKGTEGVKEEDIIFFKNQSNISKEEDILISTQLLFEYFNRLGVDYNSEINDYKKDYVFSLDFTTHIEQPLRDRGIIPQGPLDTGNIDGYRHDFYSYFYEEWSMEPTLPGLKSKEVLAEEKLINLIENLEPATMKLTENDYYGDKITNYSVNLVGVVKGVAGTFQEPTMYFSQKYFEEFKIVETGIYNTAITLDVDNSALLKEIINQHFKETGTGLQMNSEVTATLDQINYLIEMLAKVFIYVGIGFAIFASLMLLNFISVSVSYKKQEIGILRAIGARGKDVLGIFTKEAVIIALINYGLALILSIVAVININAAFKSSLNLPISILYFGVRQIVLMFIISIFVAIISSAIPVIKTARKRPIDAIKNI